MLDDYKALKNAYENREIEYNADSEVIATTTVPATAGSLNPYALVLVDGNDYIVSFVTHLNSMRLILCSSMMSWLAIEKRAVCAPLACLVTL